MISKSEHQKLHATGRKEPKEITKIRSIRNSVTKTNTGIYRVRQRIVNNKVYWEYRYVKNGKRKSICATSLDALKTRIIENGLDWIVLDEEKASKMWSDRE